MPAGDGLVAEIAGAIVDGAPIDWASVSPTDDMSERALLDQLHLLERVASLYRDPIASPVTSRDADGRHPPHDDHTKAPEEWAHLRVLDRIGRGAFGEVYRAWDTKLDREVALKLLPASTQDGASRTTAIIDEGRLLARVHHPNVVTIFGADCVDDRIGLWMELIKGRTLQQAIEDGPTFGANDVVRIGIELCRAVAAVHEAGLVHRDIKPHNVMLADTGRVVLMDFGTGLELGEGGSAALAGTPLYLAPELLTEHAPTVESDLYSLGMVLFHLLTGSYPVRAGSLRGLRLAHASGERARLKTLRPDAPTKLARIVERAIAPEPGGRYRSAATLAADLASLESRPAMWWPAATGLAVVAAFLVFRYAASPDAPVPREIRLEAIPFTAYPGYEAEPTLSPDGAQVAFTWDGERQDNHDIYVKALGAEQPLRLTSDRARDGSPAWSPDGTRIAFLRDKPEGGSEVRLIPPTGGPERPIGDVHGLAHQGLSWSPDGRSLAVVDRSAPGEPPEIFVLDAASGAKRRLATSPSSRFDILPAFSPDGRTLAFNRTLTPGGPFVHVVSVAGGEPKALVPTSFPRGRLAWIPGGKEILFAAVPLAHDGGQPRPTSYGRAETSLWKVAGDGGQARLIAGSENAGDVAVSTDGHRLVYSQGTIDWNIWRLDLRQGPAAGGGQTRFIASTRDDANPQFSPDGERVAFTSFRSGQLEIWVADGQGRHPLRLTSFGQGKAAAAPRWSPDGKTIAFDLGTENNVDIYVISASGGPPRRVTTSSLIDATPSWSRDGHWVYFASNRTGSWQVWKVRSSGEEAGSARQVTLGGGFAAIESSDGRYVYFTKRRSGTLDVENALWRIPVEGGDEEVVLDRFRSSHGSWDLTAEGLYFVDQEPSSSGTSWVVRFQGFDRRHATEVARLRYPPYLGGPAVSVSSDGRWMLSTQSEEEADLMLVENFR